MTSSGRQQKPPRFRGVTELADDRGERRFRARISRGGGQQVNLGLYPSPWLAALAYNIAAECLHGERRPRNALPESEQPSADEVRAITARVRRRLGLDHDAPPPDDRPPDADRLRTLLEITIVGFWQQQVSVDAADLSRELDTAARRLVEATHLVFWSRSSSHPTPREVLSGLLGRRLDREFRRGALTRAVLDDEDDDEHRLAIWLVYPDSLPGGGGFRETIGRLYADVLDPVDLGSGTAVPPWAAVLGLSPPYSMVGVRSAYRSRSKAAHPDRGGSHDEFVRLQDAYEQAQRFCAARGL